MEEEQTPKNGYPNRFPLNRPDLEKEYNKEPLNEA